MIVAPLEYYVVAIVCAAVGAGLGWISRDRRTALRNAAWCLPVVVATGVIELLWHESTRLDSLQQPRAALAMAIALSIPAAVGFLSAYKAARSDWKRGARIATVAVASFLAVALYPFYALYFLCYVGYDCI